MSKFGLSNAIIREIERNKWKEKEALRLQELLERKKEGDQEAIKQYENNPTIKRVEKYGNLFED